MKRRLLSLALALVLALSLLPAAALAASVEDYKVLGSNFNTDAVQNGPTTQNVITVQNAALIQSITTYHWNNGRGATPGTITVFEDDVPIGTWQATGRTSSGVANTMWDIFPNFIMYPGREYSFSTSSNATWSWNSGTQGAGMIELRGRVATDAEIAAGGAVSTPSGSTVNGYTCSKWAQSEVAKADSYGLIPGSLSGGDLTKPISRADFAAVSLYAYQKMSGETVGTPGSNPFTDTSSSEVLKAYSLGIVNGTSATTFSPSSNLTREQASTMLTRAYKRIVLPGWTLATDSQYQLNYTKPAAFADQSKISSYAVDSVAFMASQGIVNGVGNNMFDPRNNVTREQALAIAVRMVENLDTTPQTVNPINPVNPVNPEGTTTESGGVYGPASNPVTCGDLTISTKSGSGTVGLIEDNADLPASAASKGYDILLTDDVTGPVTLSLPVDAPEANASYTIYLGVPADDDEGGGNGVIWTGLETTYAGGKVTAQFEPFDAQDLLDGILTTGTSVNLKAKKTSVMQKLLTEMKNASIRGRAVRAVVGKEYVGVSSNGHFRIHIPWSFTDQGYKGLVPKGGITMKDAENLLADLEAIYKSYESKGFAFNYENRPSLAKLLTSYPMDVYGTDELNGFFGQSAMYITATGNMDIGLYNIQEGGYNRSGYSAAAKVVYGGLSHELLHCIQRGYVNKVRASVWFDEATAAYTEMVFMREKGFKDANGKGSLDGNSYAENNFMHQFEGMVPDDLLFTSGDDGYGRLPFIEYCDSLTKENFVLQVYADGGHTTQSGLHAQIVKFTGKSMKELCQGYYDTLLTTDKLTAKANEPWDVYDNHSLGESLTLKGSDILRHSFYPVSRYGVGFLRLEMGNIDPSCTSFNIHPHDSTNNLILLILDENGSYSGMRKYSATDGRDLTNIPILPRRYLLMLVNPSDTEYNYYNMANVQITFNKAKGPFASTKEAISARPTRFSGTVWSNVAGEYRTSGGVSLTLYVDPLSYAASLSLSSGAFSYNASDLIYNPSTGQVTSADGRCTAQFGSSIFTDDFKEDDMVDPFADTSMSLMVTFRKANGELEATFTGSGGGEINVTEVVNEPV